jgi:predicted dehydrogenase
LDVVRAIGGDVAETLALSDRVSVTEYRDVHSVMMRHTGGCISTVIANYTQPSGNRLERYEIHGHGITATLVLPDTLTGKDVAYIKADGMSREEVFDFSDAVGAGDGGTTEQLRYFANAVENDTAITLPAANLEEAIKTMSVAEATLGASPSALASQLRTAVVAAERQAQLAWRKESVVTAQEEVVEAEDRARL